MWALFRKEINSFFGSLIGYIILGVFLTITSLFLWLMPSSNNANIVESGLATLEPLFVLAPWLYLLLIPAMTMRSFADEKQLGTIELLLTKPISDFQIVFAKYLANLVILALTLLPTLIYYASIYMIGFPKGNIDSGASIGSYIGLFLLGSVFISIGLFTSSITKSQIIALIASVVLSIFWYIGFDFLSESTNTIIGGIDSVLSAIGFSESSLLAEQGIPFPYIVNQLGIAQHYTSISQGQIDTRDIIYYLSLTGVFLALSKMVIASRKW